MMDINSMEDDEEAKFSPNKFIEFDSSGKAHVVDRFNFYDLGNTQSTFEGIGILKTKNGHAREYWVEVNDTEIHFYKAKGSPTQEFMH